MTTGVASVQWDLRPLEALDLDGEATAIEASCSRFRARYRGRVGALDADELAEALDELERIRSSLLRLMGTVRLRVALNVDGAAERTVAAKADAVAAGAEELLRFFELEWLALPDARVEELCAAPILARLSHFLRSIRRFAPHVRPEPEERALAAREAAAYEAWVVLYEQVVWTTELELDGRDVTIDEALAYLRHAERDLRRAALHALHRALAERADVVAHCYDALVADRLAVDELRGYAGPRAERDLENELPAAVVDGMMAALDERVGLVRRWFEGKATLLGLPRLAIFDEHAPLGGTEDVPLVAARGSIESAVAGLSPELASLVRAFFDESRVDADPRPGKAGNAFCVTLGPRRPPYVLVNYTNQVDDVLRLAHELGHGLHYTLAGATQGSLTFEPAPPIGEVAAAFLELLVASHLVAHEPDAAARRALLASNLESSFRGLFHASAFMRYEEAAFRVRAAGEPLTAERLAELWIRAHADCYGEALEIPDEYGLVWMAIPHYVEGRFYHYSYVFSQLLALALHARFRESPAEAGSLFVEFLEHGASRAPLDQLDRLGLAPWRPETWRLGFAELERLVELFEGEPA